MKLKEKSILIIFIICNSTLFSQDFSLSAKYSTQINYHSYNNYETYDSYSSYTIEGLFTIWDMFEVGPSIGAIYSKDPFDTTVPEYHMAERANIKKTHFGIAVYFYPKKSKYSPFLGLRGNILVDLIFDDFDNTEIVYPGFYNYRTKNDYIYSILCGMKIRTNRLNIVFELEFQHRNYNLNFDLYTMREFNNTYSLQSSIQAINLGIGLQFEF